MKQNSMVLSKEIALLFLANEFSNSPLKVTTVLDDNNCWTGKVILEVASDEKVENLKYLNNIYGRV